MSNSRDQFRRRPALFSTYADLLFLCRGTVRFELLLALRKGESDVGALAARLDLDLPHVSRSLRELEAAELATHRQEGHKHLYSLGGHAAFQHIGAELFLGLVADDGVRIWLAIPPSVLAELEGSPKPAPTMNPAPAPSALPPAVIDPLVREATSILREGSGRRPA